MAEFYRTYEYLSPETDPVWCAVVNTILATGYRANPSSGGGQYCNLFTNALGLFDRVALSMCSLRKVQTLMLMVAGDHLTMCGYPLTQTVSFCELYLLTTLGIYSPSFGGQGGSSHWTPNKPLAGNSEQATGRSM